VYTSIPSSERCIVHSASWLASEAKLNPHKKREAAKTYFEALNDDITLFFLALIRKTGPIVMQWPPPRLQSLNKNILMFL
jgi:hypothetical protein